MTNGSESSRGEADDSPHWRNRLLQAPTGTKLRFGIIAFWIVVVFFSAPLAGKIGEVENNDASSFLPGSSESLRASELLDQFDSGDSIAAVAVYLRDGGLNEADLATIESDRAALSSTFPSFLVSPATPSEDGLATIYTLVMPDTTDSQLSDDVDGIRSTLSASAADGLEIKITGPAGIGVDLGKVFEGINGRLLLSAAAVVAVLLLLTYRSPFLWMLPLIVVGLADRLATATLYVLSNSLDVPVNGQSVGIMAILVFGAGTDYALLLIARYREELQNFERNADAMRVALRMAAPSIIASAGTVMLGLSCLLVADLNSNQSLGPAGVVGILCALVVTLTLLPAMLVVCGRGVFWPFVPRYDGQHVEPVHFWSRIGRWVERHPRRIWVATLACLALLSVGIANYSISFDLVDQFTDTPESIEGVELIAQSFPAGASQPTNIVGKLDHAEQIQQAIQDVPNVARVEQSGQTDSLVSFSVTLTSSPGTSQAFDDVQNLRNALAEVPDTEALVGGSDAESYDTERANARDEKLIIPMVLGVVFLILCALLRSILAPLFLVATSVISTVAALGVSVIVFTNFLNFGGMQPGVLLIGFVFLIALGVDYNIFLMGRAHEEAPRVGTREGMLKSISVTGSVITSAGIVLAATFAVLGFLPLVALAQIGFLVAFGVLLDTVIVRSILVPAITFDAGKIIWWPSALSKRDGSNASD